MTPEQYCQEKTAKSGSSFYYSFLFLPESQRKAIIAFYAFCREVDDIVDEGLEPDVARKKLDWWREEISRLFAGSPQHPVGQALLPALEEFDLAEEYFREIIDGMQMDLDYDAYPTFTELSLYCYRAAGVVGLIAAEIFGYQDRETLRYANDLGLALQLTNILRDVHEDAVRGRVYIPLDEIEKFKVKPEEFQHSQTSDRARELFAFQAKRAQDYYDRAFSRLPESDRYAQRSGIIMGTIYHKVLEQIQTQDYRVLEGRISLSPWNKLWTAWKTARQEHKRHHQLRRAKA